MGYDYGFLELFRREMGLSRPRDSVRRISASEALVKQIDLFGKLEGHRGCVNAIMFNSTGDLLASGSDDQLVKLWKWETKKLELSYDSGHLDNIFQVKIMPFTDDRRIITSSADGQVRLGEMLENGEVETKRLGKHQKRVHSLAVEPGSPHIFYSCGEDGVVKHFDLRSNSTRKLFYCSSLPTEKKHSIVGIRLNAIVIDPRNPNYFAIGGSEGFARVYDIRNSDRLVNTYCPHHLIESRDVHITALAYSNESELLVSYNNEQIYLFKKSMGLGPLPYSVSQEDQQKLEQPQVYSGHRNSRTVKGVSFFGPNDEYVMSGSDCGHMFIWKKKSAKLVRLAVGDKCILNQLEPHPYMPVIATSGLEKTIKLWAPSSNDFLPLPENVEKIMESNKKDREELTRITLTPDVIMHVLRLHRRQALAYAERTAVGGDVDSNDDDDDDDEDDEEEDEGISYVLGDGTSEEGDPRECNVS
ncbi:DDB1- and CUL4-associated factor 8 [Impatiens glandulifera]|uniref:DDB1- and CUL4-associated factor 8 n=1 Tax=Impatiens glandulifera TaxID=253017 RepID=UPI001FB14325|nr:DDB1- and CUL4-associated factor 8 [Impatiens glandulifera]